MLEVLPTAEQMPELEVTAIERIAAPDHRDRRFDDDE